MSPSRSGGWPATIGCGHAFEAAETVRGAGAGDRVVRGRSTRPMPPNLPEMPALEEIENLIETGRHDEAATALARVEPAWSAALAQGIVKARSSRRGRSAGARTPGLPGDQPAERAAAGGGGFARRGPRPASRRPAAGRPVHR